MSYLTPSRNSARRVSGQSIRNRKSKTSLAQEFGDDVNGVAGPDTGTTQTGMHSLAHELAVALMPEPSAGSKLLQEEFGIEYDEGAEGIDSEQQLQPQDLHVGPQGESLADEMNGYDGAVHDAETPELVHEPSVENDLANHFGSGGGSGSVVAPTTPRAKERIYQDPMDALAKDLESTDRFLTQLRHLDADSLSQSHSSSSQTSIEKFASDIIRHINDSIRDRESQVRELLEYEREFRKIAGEVNGNDVLGRLDALVEVDGLQDKAGPLEGTSARPTGSVLETIREDTHAHQRVSSNDWETNPDDNFFGDEGDETFDEEPDTPSAMKDSFTVPPPPPITGPPTVPKLIPEFVHIRSLTTTLVSSLTVISEHAQVNGAANADAGRKIRALKNKLGGWRAEWDSAEQSRIKIERWEAGLPLDEKAAAPESTSLVNGKRRLDARRITEEHLKAFELALVDAGTKTQAIMAKS